MGRARTVLKSYRGDPERWPVPTMPDIAGREPWVDDPDTFWSQPIDALPVDEERTAKLRDTDMGSTVVTSSGGNVPWMGSSYGLTFQLVAAESITTRVWDLSRPVTWKWWPFPRPTFPLRDLPLPQLVRREGDPGESSDQHWVGYDMGTGVLYESILLQYRLSKRLATWLTTSWTESYPGSGPGATWDTTTPWDEQETAGVVAIGTPLLPLLMRYEEVAAGRIDHSLSLALPNYCSAYIYPARGSDGDLGPEYPLRGGERLRLRREVVERTTIPTHRIMATAAHEYGLTLVDRNEHVAGSYTGERNTGGWGSTMDNRWQAEGFPTWTLADFEVVIF